MNFLSLMLVQYWRKSSCSCLEFYLFRHGPAAFSRPPAARRKANSHAPPIHAMDQRTERYRKRLVSRRPVRDRFCSVLSQFGCARVLVVARSSYGLTLTGKYLCYALLAMAVDLIWGYCGILSLGHAAFFSLGGYAMGMYLMREIGPRACTATPVLPDFMVFLNWKSLPWFWYGFITSLSRCSWLCSPQDCSRWPLAGLHFGRASPACICQS